MIAACAAAAAVATDAHANAYYRLLSLSPFSLIVFVVAIFNSIPFQSYSPLLFIVVCTLSVTCMHASIGPLQFNFRSAIFSP